MTDREAMKMALEALAYTLDTKHEHFDVDKAQLLSHLAVEHLQQALAQPEQTPTLFFGRAVYFADLKTGEKLAQPEQNSEAYGYAKRLAEAIWEKHYKKESPHWRPFHDVLGVLTQIDNMTCGLEKAQPEQLSGDTSDGYHTFNELYEFRKAYNAALFNEWAASGKYSVHKSKRHYNGEECFGGGWFIVVAQLPDGQISNHYEMKDWDKFQLPEADKALFEYDNHTGADVLHRLFSLQPFAQPEQEPVAWKDKTYGNLHHQNFGNSIPLYAAPPKREWVDLTEEERDKIILGRQQRWEIAHMIEAKLKEKNGAL